MSTPILNKTDDPIKTDTLTPTSTLLTFINSKVSQERIYCQECFKAKGELIAVRLDFEADRAVFSHDNCVLNPPNPKPQVEEIAEVEEVVEVVEVEPIKPFEVRNGLTYVPVTAEGWTYDPPLNIGDRCAIVTSYYHDWLFKTSKKKGHANKIEDAYRQQQGDWKEEWVNK